MFAFLKKWDLDFGNHKNSFRTCVHSFTALPKIGVMWYKKPGFNNRTSGQSRIKNFVYCIYIVEARSRHNNILYILDDCTMIDGKCIHTVDVLDVCHWSQCGSLETPLVLQEPTGHSPWRSMFSSFDYYYSMCKWV